MVEPVVISGFPSNYSVVCPSRVSCYGDAGPVSGNSLEASAAMGRACMVDVMVSWHTVPQALP